MAQQGSVRALLRRNSLVFALLTGILVSITVTGIVMIMEWQENPAGIFHDETGVHWHFVFDTVISWIVPVFLYTLVFAFLLHLVWLAFQRVMQRNFGKPFEETTKEEIQVDHSSD